MGWGGQVLRLGCKKISAAQNEMIMKRAFWKWEGICHLFGLIVESFAYHAEELEFNFIRKKVWKDFRYPGSKNGQICI